MAGMAMWRRFVQACALAFACVGMAGVGGCAILDSAVAPRSNTVNQSSDDALNDGVLLNIIRAANSEPLNFMSFAKYSASGQLQLNSQFQLLYPVENLNPQSTYGPVALNTQASGSFDVQNLESKDFYNAMLQPLPASVMELWLRQGLPRELVFLVLLKSIRITMPNGLVFEYRNDPSDDKWFGQSGPAASAQCTPKRTGIGLQTNYGTSKAMWTGVHADDCRYQKFRYLVDLAIKYGLTIETITVPNPKARKGSTEPATISVQQTCYDPAIARESLKGRRFPPLSICGRNRPNNRRGKFDVAPIGTFNGIELVTRSPFGIFQYLGLILRSGSSDIITLGTREQRSIGESNPQLLTIVTGPGDCFATAWYRGVIYCVPNENSANTKVIFTMLRALIAGSTSPLTLVGTPTVRVTP